MLAIAGRELRLLLLSPIGWTILAVVQVVLAYIFLLQLERFMRLQPSLASSAVSTGVTEMVVGPLLGTAGFLLLLTVPLLTMGLISGERRAGALVLLLSSPVSATAIVLGKFLGALGFLACLLVLVALMPMLLLNGGSLDFGLFAAGMLGLALLSASFVAAGLFVSCMSAQPAVAAIGTFGLLFLLWVLDLSGNVEGDAPERLFAQLSLMRHFDALLNGVFDTRDVAYYLLFIATFLGLSIRRLDAERLSR